MNKMISIFLRSTKNFNELNLRNVIKKILISFFILFIFRIFASPIVNQLYFPHYRYIESFFIIIFLAYSILILINYIKKGIRIPVFYIFVLSLAFVPIYSAFLSKLQFNQEIYLGLAAERTWLLCFSGFFVFRLLERKVINIEIIKNTVIVLAFILLLAGIYVTLTVDPLNAYKVRFEVLILSFAVIFFVNSYIYTKNKIYLLIICFCFLYLVYFFKGRGLIFFLSFVSVLIYYYNRPFKIFLIGLVFIFLVSVSAFFLLKSFSKDRVELMSSKVYSLIDFAQGNESNDPSVESRRIQIKRVNNYWKKRPFSRIIFGSGKLSQHFGFKDENGRIKEGERGYKHFFGYFYPSDIGIFGMVFLYGILGTLYVNFMYLFAFRFKTSEKYKDEIVFLDSLRYFVLFIFIYSFQTGMTIFSSEKVIVPLFILYFTSKEYNDSDYEVKEMWIERVVNKLIYGNRKTVPMKTNK